MWDPILGHLSKSKLQLHFPKLPGHAGRALPSTFTMDEWVKDVLAQLPFSVEENAFFIGHSMGGYLLSRLAVTHPHLVRGLCLFHSRGGTDTEEKRANRLRAIEAAKENQAVYVRGMITSLFADEHRMRLHDAIEAQIKMAKSLPLETIVASQTVMHGRPDNIAALRDRHFPLYYFLGEKDQAVKLEEVSEELHSLPGHTAHIAHDCGHMAHLENPKEAGAFIQRILKADG
jgi:pimeloyl-ACP methyl ester carboxylesterase